MNATVRDAERITGTYALPHGYRVEFRLKRLSAQATALECAWSPHVPRGPKDWQSIAGSYRKARDAYLAELANATGGMVACLEI